MSYDDWRTKLDPGFFFIGDAAFRLFTRKITLGLDEIQWWAFDTEDAPAVILSALIDGQPAAETEVDISGSTIWYRLPPGASGVLVQYSVQDLVDDSLENIIRSPVELLASGDPHIFLDPLPLTGEPVVFTNDETSAEQHDEFAVDFNTGEVTFMDAIPASGTFEYGASGEMLPVLDLNPANSMRISGLLNWGPGARLGGSGEATLGIGSWKKALDILAEAADDYLQPLISEADLYVAGANMELFNAPMGDVILVGLSEGADQLLGVVQLDGIAHEIWVTVSIPTDYDWGISLHETLEPDPNDRRALPYTHYSGYNKGLKRPFDSQRETKSLDTVQSMGVGQPSTVEFIGGQLVGSQRFDKDDFPQATYEAWGWSYGANFGSA